MTEFTLVDTFPAFLDYWRQAQHAPLDVQIDRWMADYMAQWPALLAIQQENYAEEGLDWREVAREHVFPFLQERLPLMVQIRKGLVACVGPTFRNAEQVLGLDFDVTFVIYVGLGCGAGWATRYQGSPACLFGLENAAECGWVEQETLASLTAHELSHLFHQQRREQHDVAPGNGPYWQLYEEGFAQRCEHIVVGSDTWHQQTGQPGWVSWCEENTAWLAAEFLSTVRQERPITPFFGSWFDIQGWRECGYFLGHQMIAEWERTSRFGDITLLTTEELEQRVPATLLAMSKGSG